MGLANSVLHTNEILFWSRTHSTKNFFRLDAVFGKILGNASKIQTFSLHGNGLVLQLTSQHVVLLQHAQVLGGRLIEGTRRRVGADVARRKRNVDVRRCKNNVSRSRSQGQDVKVKTSRSRHLKVKTSRSRPLKVKISRSRREGQDIKVKTSRSRPLKVKTSQGQDHSRSRPLKVKTSQGQDLSRSRSDCALRSCASV